MANVFRNQPNRFSCWGDARKRQVQDVQKSNLNLVKNYFFVVISFAAE